MSAVAHDLFRAWTDLTLAGLRTYTSALQMGLEATSRAMPIAPSPFPSPAIRRTTRKPEIWPAAGSFGGGTNAVAAWSEVASSMMGAANPARFPAFPGLPFSPLAWMTPAQPQMLPWLSGMMNPAAFAPMATGASLLPWMTPRPTFGWPMAMPGFSWPLQGFGMPSAATPNLMDPFGLWKPMLEAFAQKPQGRSRYH